MKNTRMLLYLVVPLAVAGAFLVVDNWLVSGGGRGKTETKRRVSELAAEEAVLSQASAQNAQDEAEQQDPGSDKKKAAGAVPHEEKNENADNRADTKDTWQPPTFEERKQERREMVKQQIVARGPLIEGQQHPDVLEAMRRVPRHLFTPDKHKSTAYADGPLPIGHGQTISQPYIVALMTAYLQVDEGDRILEIGTGSGYQAAVLSCLTQNVYSIEIVEDLAESAQSRLKKLGYDPVKVKAGDGYYGWQDYAPFDGVIVTCAAGHVPPPLLRQLKAGGRMVIPVGGPMEVQRLTLVTKNRQGQTSTQALMPVRFVPMKGEIEE